MGTFSDPILGDGGELIRDSIRSSDYVPGVSGWRVGTDGSAEFSDADLRGQLVTAAPDGSRVQITADPVAAVTLYPAPFSSGGTVTGPAGLRTGTDPASAVASGLVLEGPAHADGQPVLFLGRGTLAGVYAAIRAGDRLNVTAAKAVSIDSPQTSVTGAASVTGATNLGGALTVGGTASFAEGVFGSGLGVFESDVATNGGDLVVNAAGKGLKIAEGANAKMGAATLAAGTVTVANTSVTAGSRIFLTAQVPGGTVGALYVSARTPGVSFTIRSTNAADTSLVAYHLIQQS